MSLYTHTLHHIKRIFCSTKMRLLLTDLRGRQKGNLSAAGANPVYVCFVLVDED